MLPQKRFLPRVQDSSRMNINTQEYWDQVYRQEWSSGAAQTDRYVRDYGQVHDAIVALILPGSRVLDIGCGLGLLCRKISQRVQGARVTGVDFAPIAVSLAAQRDRTLGIEYLCLDIRTGLSHLAGEFDVVIMGEVLEHLDEPYKAVGDAMGLLRPGGCFVISCPHDDEVPDAEHVRTWGHDELFHLLQPYGSVVSFRHFAGTCFAPWVLAWMAKAR